MMAVSIERLRVPFAVAVVCHGQFMFSDTATGRGKRMDKRTWRVILGTTVDAETREEAWKKAKKLTDVWVYECVRGLSHG
jgi:hypothetical protein